MATSTTSFGSGFDGAAFREKITAVMNMGLPEDTGERATFRWKTIYDNTIEAPSGTTYDFSVTPTTEESPADVQIPVAVEFVAPPTASRAISGSALGEFNNPRAIVTLLDTYYDQVATADEVILGGNTYIIEFWAPPIGLFDVTVYQAYVLAVDET